jgi:hypothetical protein
MADKTPIADASVPGTQILSDRSDNYRPSTTDQQNRQLFTTRPPMSVRDRC